MKIAIIFPKDAEGILNPKSNISFGGATVQVYLIAKELSKYKELEVYSAVSSFEGENKDLNLKKVYNSKNNFISNFLEFNNFIRKYKPDLIIQHGLSLFSCLLAIYCKVNKMKFVYMYASDTEVKGLYQTNLKKCKLFKYLLKYTNLLITQNRFQQKYLKDNFRKSSEVLYQGFDIKDSQTKKEEFILWVGRASNEKNPILFLELAKNNLNLNFKIICPLSKDKLLFNRLKEESSKVSNLEFISFVPFEEIQSYFNKALVLVNTSDYEGYPQTFIQAGIGRTPIISLNVNPDEFITRYNCGFMCKKSFNLLNIKLNVLLKNKPIYRVMSKNIFRYVSENHNIKKNCNLLVNMLSEIQDD